MKFIKGYNWLGWASWTIGIRVDYVGGITINLVLPTIEWYVGRVSVPTVA